MDISDLLAFSVKNKASDLHLSSGLQPMIRVHGYARKINSPFISELIMRCAVHEIKDVIAKSPEMGMQTFDQALFYLHEAGSISYEEAIRNADWVNDVRLKIKLEEKVNRGMDFGAWLREFRCDLTRIYLLIKYGK